MLPLLAARSAIIEELLKPPPRQRLKSLDTRLCSPVLQAQRPPAPVGQQPSLLEEESDSDASYISEGEPSEPSELVSWGKGHRGAWWRVRASLREDLVVRGGVSLASAELRRAAPGELLQQKGHPRVLCGGRSQGCIRMPIQPCGWVTADASRCGGPQYLIRAHTPRWRAIYQSPQVNGHGDVIVRAAPELDSEAVLSLHYGDVVEQAGPSRESPSGILRMPVLAARRGGASGEEQGRWDDVLSKVNGWVTVDASAAGGPVFFKLVPDPDGGAPAKPRRNNHKSHQHSAG